MGQKVELTVTARDAKGTSLTGVTLDTKVERDAAGEAPEPIELYTQNEEYERIVSRRRPAR